MKTRQLGTDGPRVSALGLGCMGMSQSYGPRDDAASAATLVRAAELGVSLFDTANVYGSGHNEELLGRALPPFRHQVMIATKVGLSWSPDGALTVDGRPERIKRECDLSLHRLGIDCIGLYYLHRVDPAVPVQDSVGTMADLVRKGKVRHLGLSECSPADLRKAQAVHPIAALQSEWSLWTRDVEAGVIPTCRELGIGIVPFSPLGRGFLSGAVTSAETLDVADMRRGFPRFSQENLQHNLRLFEPFEAQAQRMNVSSAQLALAWVLAQGEDVAPIPGTKSVAKLEANLAALHLALDGPAVHELAVLLAPDRVAGARYPTVFIKNQP